MTTWRNPCQYCAWNYTYRGGRSPCDNCEEGIKYWKKDNKDEKDEDYEKRVKK